jgi:hypothetical protein
VPSRRDLAKEVGNGTEDQIHSEGHPASAGDIPAGDPEGDASDTAIDAATTTGASFDLDASWLLVGELRASRLKSYDFHMEVRDRASGKQTQLGIICCWVLGRPVLPWAIAPAVPALRHPMSAVIRAYHGLLQHLEKLEAVDTEMPITSIIWRVGALVDGIIEAQTDKDSLHTRFGRMRTGLLPILTAGEQLPVDALVDNLAGKRNVLTHLHPEREMTFESVVDLHPDLSSVVEHVTAITLGTFFSIAGHHADQPPPRGEIRRVEDELSAMVDSLA